MEDKQEEEEEEQKNNETLDRPDVNMDETVASVADLDTTRPVLLPRTPGKTMEKELSQEKEVKRTSRRTTRVRRKDITRWGEKKLR